MVYVFNACMKFDFTGLLTGNAAIGYQSRTFDNDSGVNGYDTVDGPRFDINLNWQPTKIMSVDWLLNQTVGETSLIGSAGYVATNTEVQLAYEVLRHLTLGAHVGFDNRDYEAIDRNDDRWRAGIGLSYVFNRYLVGNMRYRHVDRDSNDDAFDYVQNVFSLNLVSQF